MMSQLSFNMLPVRIKTTNPTAKLLLGDWQLASSESKNWVRRLIPNDNFSCIGLMVSWEVYIINSFYWLPFFHGQDLWHLKKIYHSYYPDVKPQFQGYQIKEAKQHLDDFIGRVNKLGAFL
jgi:hypothetical protein